MKITQFKFNENPDDGVLRLRDQDGNWLLVGPRPSPESVVKREG